MPNIVIIHVLELKKGWGKSFKLLDMLKVLNTKILEVYIFIYILFYVNVLV